MTIKFKAPLFGSKSAVGRLMDTVRTETSGLAIDFTANQMLIRDRTTPSNIFFGSPTDKLTYTSPSVKMTRGPDGLLRYQAHNLFVNSAAPANQSITVVSGATYAITLTDGVTTTLSGAASGTITAGTTNITASSTTLTFGSTSGSGTVHVRRTPSDSTYLETAGSARYDLPYEWDVNGNPLGILVEEARTNLVLRGSDFTQIWTLSNITAAKTAIGPDGVTNSASTLTATAANGTALRAITSASSARITSCFIKRRTGTGVVELTQNNGTTWTPVAVTSDWSIVEIPSEVATNPTVGIRIVTSGDEVDVALFQHTTGTFTTSPIETFAATVTRAADNLTLATTEFPWNAAEGTMVAKCMFSSFPVNRRALQMDDGTNAERITLDVLSAPTALLTVVDANTNQVILDSGAPTPNTTFGIAARFKSDEYGISTDGGAVNKEFGSVAIWDANTDTYLRSTYGTSLPSVTTLRIGSGASANSVLNGWLRQITVIPRAVTDPELQQRSGG